MSGIGTRFSLFIAFIVLGTLGLTAITAYGETATGTNPESRVYHLHEIDTSVIPVDNPPQGPSGGDLLMFTARVSSGGKRFGRYIGNCAYMTKTEIFCTIELNVFGEGRLEFSGELSTQQSNSVFAVTGGTQTFARTRGYLRNHQSATGTSADQVLYLDVT